MALTAPGSEEADIAMSEPAKRSWLRTAWSTVTFIWVTPIVSAGAKRQLQHEDLFALPDAEHAALLRQSFWQRLGLAESRAEDQADFDRLAAEQRALAAPLTTRRLLAHVVGCARREVVLSALCMALYSSAQLAMPLLLREVVLALAEDGNRGLWLAVTLLVVSVLGGMCGQLQYHWAFTAGRKARALYSSLVFEKALGLRLHEQRGAGELVNMVSGDAQKLQEVSQFMHLFWAGPLQIVVAIIALVVILGVPVLAGVAVLLLIGPLNWRMAQLKRSLRQAHMPLMDARVRLCCEVLAGIRVVKLFAWETPFIGKILEARKAEIKYVFRELYLFGTTIGILIVTPMFASMATFSAVAGSGTVLRAADTFAALAMFNVLKFPLQQLSQALMLGAQVVVSIERLQALLQDRAALRTPKANKSKAKANKSKAKANKANKAKAKRGVENAAETETEAEQEERIPAEVDKPLSFIMRPGEVDTDAVPATTEEDGSGPLLCMQEASFAWGVDRPAVLHDVTIELGRNELIAVVGPVGSGKSSLVAALLGELALRKGRFQAYAGEVAFCTQTPWILNATVEENITFGKPFDEKQFSEVLSACCLWSDLEQLHEREKTVIGERGVTLSGGQKARIALARAAYSGARLVVLDDPLSALDAHVGKLVFERLLAPETGLLADRARVLVTHAAQNLGACDRMLVLFEGRVAFQGPFSTLEALGGDSEDPADAQSATLAEVVRSLLSTAQADEDEDQCDQDEADVKLATLKTKDEEKREVESRGSVAGRADEGPLPSKVPARPKKTNKALMKRDFQSSQLMTAEDRSAGKVARSVAHKYILAAGGYCWMVMVLALMAMERLTYIAADYWLATWADAELGSVQLFGFDMPPGNTAEGLRFYSIGYVVAVMLNAAFVVVRCFAFMHGGGVAARALFEAMTWRVMRCPVSFFETTPLGRITNRFSFDTEMTDELLVQALLGMVASTMWMLSAVIVMVGVAPLAGVVVIPVVAAFLLLHRFYRSTCVELQRLDSTSRSPVQSQLRDTIEGVATVRALSQSSRVLRESEHMVDINTRAVLAFLSSNRWLGVRLELLGALVTFAVALAAWLARATIDPGLVGLAILWSFNLTTSFNYFVTLSTQAEAKLTSVERMLYYVHELPEEAPVETTGSRPPPSWPEHGRLVLDNVELRYRPSLPPALAGLSLSIEAGEHVGVCGRTGAGKSSLAAALFRLHELSDGTISVDGVDLSGLGLGDVRGRALAIIPQEPTLFSGTVRFNVDPFGQASDDEVWRALEVACLANLVRGLDGGLQAEVGESGSSLSQGQRQLICLARAVLRSPKVLVCDEMTSSVDGVTDALIQKAIRSEFNKCTVITIAHRLHSIMDSDRIMVLDRGALVEFDTPSALASKPDGAFRSLINSCGPATAAELLGMLKSEESRGNSGRSSN